MELWEKAYWWAVGTDEWGNVITYDPCETWEEAVRFVQTELKGHGAVLTYGQLITALDNGEEVCS